MTSAFAPTAHAATATPVNNWVDKSLGQLRALLTAVVAMGSRRVLSKFEEAQAVRAMASDLQATDPGFAQDLFAAADRHQFGDEA